MKNNIINVGSWNIFTGYPWGISLNADNTRIDQILNYIQSSDLDILALQEVQNIYFIDLLKNKFNNSYHIFYSKKNIIIRNCILAVVLFLLYYFIQNIIGLCVMFLFVNFIIKNSTIYNFLLSEIEGGLVLLVKNELSNKEIIEYKYQNFINQDNDILNTINKRGFQEIEIPFKNNLILTIFNTHLNSSPYTFNLINKKNYLIEKSNSRENQIREIEEKTIKKKNCILLGDFNTTSNVNELHLKEFNLKDSFIETNNMDYSWSSNNLFTNTIISSKFNERIDYILTKNLNTISTNIIFKDPPASDHYCVTAQLNIKKSDKKISKINKALKVFKS